MDLDSGAGVGGLDIPTAFSYQTRSAIIRMHGARFCFCLCLHSPRRERLLGFVKPPREGDAIVISSDNVNFMRACDRVEQDKEPTSRQHGPLDGPFRRQPPQLALPRGRVYQWFKHISETRLKNI